MRTQEGLNAARDCELDLSIGQVVVLSKHIDQRVAEAVAAEREACCALEPPAVTNEQEDEWIYEHGGRYADAFWAGWEAYRAAIRQQGGEGGS